jgi:hypothetical protein
VEGLGVGGGVGAELVGEGLAEVLVGRRGRRRAHRRRCGRAWWRARRTRRRGRRWWRRGRGPGRGGGRRRPGRRPRRGAWRSRSAARPRGGEAGPSRRRAHRPGRSPAEQGQRTLGGGEGEGRLAGQAGGGLGGEPFRLVQVDLDPGPGHEPPALAVAGDRLRPSTARSRLTRVARLASGSLGSRPPHRASAATSAGTTEPRRANSSFSSVRPLRLASSAAGTTRPSTATARTPSTCTRRLVCCLMHGFWRSPSPVARAAAAAGPGKPPQAPAADPCVANRAAHSLQPPASSGTPSSRSAAAWSWW